jgi:hypothetical protein
MPWVRFTANFDWSPRRNVEISYKADCAYLVTTRCANEAVAKGKADKIRKPESAKS